jgi:hypothetical protein
MQTNLVIPYIKSNSDKPSNLDIPSNSSVDNIQSNNYIPMISSVDTSIQSNNYMMSSLDNIQSNNYMPIESSLDNIQNNNNMMSSSLDNIQSNNFMPIESSVDTSVNNFMPMSLETNYSVVPEIPTQSTNVNQMSSDTLMQSNISMMTADGLLNDITGLADDNYSMLDNDNLVESNIDPEFNSLLLNKTNIKKNTIINNTTGDDNYNILKTSIEGLVQNLINLNPDASLLDINNFIIKNNSNIDPNVIHDIIIKKVQGKSTNTYNPKNNNLLNVNDNNTNVNGPSVNIVNNTKFLKSLNTTIPDDFEQNNMNGNYQQIDKDCASNYTYKPTCNTKENNLNGFDNEFKNYENM